METTPNTPTHADKIQAALKAQNTADYGLAINLYNQILAEAPQHFDANHLLGVLLLILQKPQDAAPFLTRATQIKPEHATAYYNLGLCMDNLGNKPAAIDAYSKAISRNPQDHRAYNNRAKSLRELGKTEQSLADCEEAIRLKPDYAAAYQNRGIALRDLRRINEALDSYTQALRLDPNLADALYGLGNLMIELKRYDEAMHPLAHLLNKAPNYPYALGAFFNAKIHGCDWHDYDKFTQVLASQVRAGQATEVPFSFLAYSKSASDQLICSKNYTLQKYPAQPKSLYQGEKYAHEKIRVAYLSADFHNHATSYLMAGVFETQNQAQFEWYAISFGPNTRDEMQQRLIPCFSKFIDAKNLSDEETAQLIRQLEIDIVVDLKGFTGDSRTSIFTYRAAPIQINYLGYPGTMGADYIDYIIADPHLIPENDQQFYSEKIIYMPDTYQANDDKRAIAPEAISRAAAGLPAQGFVFCCFNNNYKITPEIFDIWMRLLRQVAGSVLWLLDDNATAVKNLKKEAVARGVDAERLIFAPRVKLAEHLARQRLANLFLDTLPYNAHTTASDALWGGLPIITCCGTSFAARVTTSLLSALKMESLITHNLDDYEALAFKLATKPELLNSIRQTLAQNIHTQALFDTKRFSHHLESAYLQAWQLHQNGQAPQHIWA